ncbi:transmembrane protein 198-like [Betta splendens]|uniref:Transmembrane protein 198 n=1 Tax=Betta splendens TaxID=158456 RepID=A0A6P7N057_BETSP|nr:transmembrane protein 198-like [Betta splendens]XP_055366164.1 transmembrane protein 198-like [Betta splendens]
MDETPAFMSEEAGAALTEVEMCTFEINMKYEVLPCAVCSICLSFGLIYCFFGYRCFKVIMFFSGFTSGAAAVLLLYHREPVLDARLGAEAKAGLGLGVAVLCGLAAMLATAVGLLLSGLQLGGLLSGAALLVLGHFRVLGPAWVPVGAALAAGAVAAVLALQWQKLFGVVYTSVFGATAVTLCSDYLVGAFVLPDRVYDVLCEVVPRPLCWFNWAVAGIFPLLSVMGVLVQWRLTAKGASHRGTSHKKLGKYSKKYGRGESVRRPPPYRRRRPPPLKRYAGDVLAPSYLQSLRERQMGTGSSTSSVSTITHTLIDFDFETGSMVPLTAASPVFSV